MDNIFEILIYLFIIISFLSSFFKKKKPETKPGAQTVKSPPEPVQVKSSQQEEYDLLKEIEKMFKTESSFPEKQEEISFEKEKSYETSAEHFDSSVWHQPTPSEHRTIIEQAETWEEKSRKAEAKRKAINEETVRKAQLFEQHLAAKQVSKTEMRKNIRNSFKDPKTLKEYIVFSEIIGKPKAFQE